MKVIDQTKKKKLIMTTFTNFLLLLAVVAVSLVSFMPAKNEAQEASAERLLAIYEGNRNSGAVSLMINVYWGTEYLDGMLEALAIKNAKTTFFVGGSWANENPEMLKKIAKAGHEIASHGYSHKDHAKLSYSANSEEISACHSVVKSILGVDMTLFAPPSGSYNNSTIEAATALGYKTIMWTRDTIDWRDKNTALIANRATKDMKAGDLVLMHPTANTLEALPQILDCIYSAGLVVKPVSQLL